ncbi:MAG: hypothetical protein RL320_1677 [Pseudomonadota bacterium]|jgi:DNA polymerase-3 subunit gamma/tau
MSNLLFDDLAPPTQSLSPVVLARKYRPRQFGSVVGQDAVVKALQHALRTGRMHHAYLLTGARGVGKTTIARILAKALNCETGVTEEPCGQCSVCQEVDRGRFVDYLEIDAASNRGVGDIQEVLEQSRFSPTSGRTKVIVIDEVHMLSGHAFNAMLKTLEEPPERVLFVLATTDPQKIPVTVLSRCLQFGLKNLRRDVLSAHLAFVLGQEGVVFEAPAIDALARAARGSVRDALSLTDQAIAHGGGSVTTSAVEHMLGLVGREALLSLALALAQGRPADAITSAEHLMASGATADAILDDLARLYHERIVLGVLGQDPSVPPEPELLSLSQHLSDEDAQLAYQIATLGRRDLVLAPDEQTGLQMTILRIAAFTPEGAAASSPATPAKAAPKPSSAPFRAPVESTTALPLSAVTPESWPELMKKLRLTGLARQFAQQSALLTCDVAQGRTLHAAVPIAALADPELIERVQAALSDLLGQGIRLKVEVRAAEAPTAAIQDAALAAERQSKAEQAIAQSPVVQAFVEAFDATLIPGSVKWAGPDSESSPQDQGVSS